MKKVNCNCSVFFLICLCVDNIRDRCRHSLLKCSRKTKVKGIESLPQTQNFKLSLNFIFDLTEFTARLTYLRSTTLGCIAAIKGLDSQRLWQKQNIFLQILSFISKLLKRPLKKNKKIFFLKRTTEP